jgi:hypothetical protein
MMGQAVKNIRRTGIPASKGGKPNPGYPLHAIIVDDPYAVEPGDKSVAMRTTRNDPLGALHARKQIDEAQYHAGRAFQLDFETAERGPRAIDPSKEAVDGGRMPEPITEAMRKAVARLNRVHGILGQSGASIAHDVLIGRMSLDRVAAKREMKTEAERKYLGRRLREGLDDMALVYGFAGKGRDVVKVTWKPSMFVPGVGLVYLTEDDVVRIMEEDASANRKRP